MSSHLRLEVTADAAALAQHAAGLIIQELRQDPRLLLCAASGDTPTATYETLAQAACATPDLFEQLRIIKLDEWGGIEMSHPSSCESYLQNHLVRPLQVDPGRYLSCQSNPEDPLEECTRMNQLMKDQGPIGVSLLGLGLNGHLGFNEPADRLQPSWHVAELSSKTLSHPMVEAMEPKPCFGMTMGMNDILASRVILLLVAGRHKRSALQTLMSRRVTSSFPASMLWQHPDVTVICDQAAADS